MVIFILILDGNYISDGATIGSLINITGLRKADLTMNRLGSAGTKQLADTLINNKTLEELIVSSNNIGVDGFVDLMKSIKGNNSFKSFNFASNGLNPTVIEHISIAIKENSRLVALDLSDNQLGDECIISVLTSLEQNKSLEYLNLTKTEMTSHSTDYLIPFFSNHDHITGIKLGYNKLNPTVGINIGRVVSADNLVVLDVRNTNIGGNGTYGIFEGLQENISLIELIVNGNAIHKNGLRLLTKILQTNTTLQKLGLRFCDIGKAGFIELSKALEQNSSLTYLDISHNTLESLEACRKFAEAIGHQKTKKTEKISKTAITELNISGCLIGYKQMEELAEGLYRNRSIKTLHLDDNDLSAKGMRAVSTRQYLLNPLIFYS